MELIAQLAAAQLALDAVISDLSRNGADAATIAALRSQIAGLTDLRQQVGGAKGAELASLRSEVASAVASSQAAAQQAGGAASNTASANLTAAERARATIEAVGRDLFEHHALDPYLQFTSAEDEQAYRKRERERAGALALSQSLHTPEGDRRALEIEQQQLNDAAIHGADRCPEYSSIRQRLSEAEKSVQPPSGRQDQNPMNVDHTSATNETRSSNGLDDVMAALKEAGVQHGADTSPAGGHGMAKVVNTALTTGASKARN